MKFLLFLFSVYLLALGFLPCADEVCAGQQNRIEILATQSHDNHSEESCPPFCTCSCCSMHIAAPAAGSFSLVSLQQATDTRRIIFVDHLPLPGIQNSIWQPPRLG